MAMKLIPPTDGDLFAFPISIKATLAHLRQDMRDDWFPDPLLYKDLFDRPSNLREVLCTLLLDGNGQYPAKSRSAYDIPKASHGLRYSLETDFYDRFMLQAICSYLMPYIDPLLSNRVLGHRYDPDRQKEKHIFKNRIDLWNTFQGITKAELTGGSTILCTDLINYFENIKLEEVISSLRSKLPFVKADGLDKVRIRNAIATLEALMASWCYSDRHGLPQNRDASSFLANVLLDKVDRAMVALGYDYYRYVDDIRVVCCDERLAKRARVDMIRELRKVGLNINSSKTALVSRDSPPELLVSFFPALDDRTIAIDNMWKSRSKRVISRSVPLLRELLIELVSNDQTQARQFRFCINRLKTLLEANVFDCASILTPDIEDALIDLVMSQPASTDQVCKILEQVESAAPVFKRIELFLLDSEASIYGWQNYQLWLLLAFKRCVSEDLIDVAQVPISSETHSPEDAAKFVYLARCGREDLLAPLIPWLTPNWPYQHTRLFLLAMAEVDQSTLTPLINKLCPKTTGTIKRYKANKSLDDGIFFREPASGIASIYDRLNPYD